MNLKIDEVIDRFIASYISMSEENQQPLTIEFDSDWPSPCYQQSAEDGEWVDWLPVKQTAPVEFDELEQALEISFPEELKALFSRYWSDNLDAKTTRGSLQLLLPWNEEDLERLQKNLVGHVLMKRRLGQKITLFFAVTDEEDFIISVDVETQQVVLEQVGLEPKEILAPSLSDFIAQLTPVVG